MYGTAPETSVVAGGGALGGQTRLPGLVQKKHLLRGLPGSNWRRAPGEVTPLVAPVLMRAAGVIRLPSIAGEVEHGSHGDGEPQAGVGSSWFEGGLVGRFRSLPTGVARA